MYNLTWNQLIELEPALESLLLDVRIDAAKGRSNSDFDWERGWNEAKRPIADFVGWHRRDKCDPILKSKAAYDVVYWTLWNEFHA